MQDEIKEELLDNSELNPVFLKLMHSFSGNE